MNKAFFIRLLNYEYWPIWAFYLPLFPYFLIKGIMHGHLFYFSNANPGIDEFGGLFFDSKDAIDKQFQDRYMPMSIRVLPFNDEKALDYFISNLDIPFPLIVKPDAGGRGKGVLKVNTREELLKILSLIKTPFLIQEFVTLELEYGVFISYVPEINQYKVISLTEKQYFGVMGNGSSSIKELILEDDRGVVFFKNLKKRSEYKMDYIPSPGEYCVIHTLGNHCNGTRFINRNLLLSVELDNAFNQFMQSLDGIKYGRFDLKVNTFQDLVTFQNIKIIEFNGIAAEPIHIYDSSVGYINALRSFIAHWQFLNLVSIDNKKLGIVAASHRKVIHKIRLQFF